MGKPKYKQILTRDFLDREYVKKNKSLAQLSKEMGIYITTIRNYILAYNIKLRTHKEQAAISSPGGKLKYEKLLTKEFFFKNYVNSKNSITDLALQISIHKDVLRNYMKRLNIPIRTYKEQINLSYPPKEFQLTEENIAFFDGLLLGDGSIPFKNNGSRSYTQGCKHREYLKYIEKRAKKYGITTSPIATGWTSDPRCKNKGYIESFFQTHRYKTFELFRKRWYPAGKKIVPRDLRFNKDSLLQWYLCDGNFYRHITLCTQGFHLKDLQFLKKLLKIKLSINVRIKSDRGLALKKSDSFKFLNYIGKSPVKCYAYKWKDNETKEKKLEKNKRAREIYHAKKSK